MARENKTSKPKKIRTTYLLIVYMPSGKKIRVAKLGEIFFKKGIYVYVGSGGTSPIKRIQRHASGRKRSFWHIDFLTRRSQVLGAVLIESSQRLECHLSQLLASHFPSIDGFGCSDCLCRSHLFYLAKKEPKGGER